MTKKFLVVYHSRYGYTKQYAEWISESLGCPTLSIEEVHESDLATVDHLIFGSGLYAGKIQYADFVESIWIK